MTFPKKISHYWGLDIIRFIAAAMVAMLHLSTATLSSPNIFTKVKDLMDSGAQYCIFGTILPSIVFTGSLGVQIFFIISGFVIFLSLNNTQSAKEFIIGRLIRLMPTLWLSSILSYFILSFFRLGSFADNLLPLLRSIIISPVGSHINDVVWTLALEVVFYIAICYFHYFCKRINSKDFIHSLTALSIIYWCLYLIFARLLKLAFFKAAYEDHFLFKISSIFLMQHGIYFGIGALFAEMTQHYRAVKIKEVALLIMAIASSAVQVMWTANYYSNQYRANGASQSPTLELIVWSALLAAFFISTITTRQTKSVNSRRYTILRLLGLSSYPMYLLHSHIGELFMGLTAFLPMWLMLIATIILTIAAAMAFNSILETAVFRRIISTLRTNLEEFLTLKKS